MVIKEWSGIGRWLETGGGPSAVGNTWELICCYSGVI